MSELTHVGCPACGSTMGVRRGEQTSLCTHCDSRGLVVLPDYVPRFRLEPRVDGKQAVNAVRGALRTKPVKRRLAKEMRPASPELFYVPFYEVEGLVASTVTERVRDAGPGSTMGAYGANMDSWSRDQAPLQMSEYFSSYHFAQLDTKVALRDHYRSGCAENLSDWGVVGIDVRSRRRELGVALQQFDTAEVSKQGYALPAPPIPLHALEPGKIGAGRSTVTHQHAELLATEKRYVYYPVWRLTFRDGRHPYQATVDALTGAVLHCRAPEDRRFGIQSTLVTVGIWSLIIGKLLGYGLFDHRPWGSLSDGLAVWMILLPAALAATVPFLMIFAVFWAQLRFDGEVVVRPDGISLEKLGRPPETKLERLVLKLADALEALGPRGEDKDARRVLPI